MKGNLYAWIVVLAVGWAATFLWIIFTVITVEHIYPWADAQIDDVDAQAVLDRQIAYHNYWPMLLMAGLTMYAIVSSIKQQPTDNYYGA